MHTQAHELRTSSMAVLSSEAGITPPPPRLLMLPLPLNSCWRLVMRCIFL